jgi:1-deoxy-D-xylulose-5-phosphate reductoisomerase
VKRVIILGSTGSIGKSAVDVILQDPGEFEVVGLAAGKNVDKMSEQLDMFPGALFCMEDKESVLAVEGRNSFYRHRVAGVGQDGMEKMIVDTSPDLVINALVGIAGLRPTLKTLSIGCQLALANKESLVTGGELISAMDKDIMGNIIPVDSEHFSISRCLRGYQGEVEEVILTASGGPFFGRDMSSLRDVTVDEVLDHPTWSMGRKVTVDSALLINKGLEVIEAHYLFDFPLDRINVVIHPQSKVHSFVRLSDGSLLAHLSPPDMRLPLMSALYYPEIHPFHWDDLSLELIQNLEFYPLHREQYPAFDLVLRAIQQGGTTPVVLNAVDELAVGAFLRRRIGFLDIILWIDEALSAHRPAKIECLDNILEADRWARDFISRNHSESVLN